MIRTILFDLDGTLLPMDQDDFLRHYFARVAQALAPYIPPDRVAAQILAAVEAMLRSTDPALTCQDVFWADFSRRTGYERPALEPVFERFYAEAFPGLRAVLPGDLSAARRVLDAVLAQGYEIALCTQPVFPRQAIMARLDWIGVRDYPWRLITVLEEMHACKPHPAYYREVLDRIGRAPGQCLMVGNDVEEDGAAAALGIPTYFVTDHLIQRGAGPLPGPGGSLTQLPAYVNGLAGRHRMG